MAKKVKISCPRCEGKGVLPRYYYNRKGVCFLCWGAKVITVKAGENEKAKDVYERMKQEEADKLEANPPKVAMPEKMRNKAYDDDVEREAINTNGTKKLNRKVTEALQGLTMLKQLSGIDAVKNLVKDAGVPIPEKADDKTIMDVIQKHLETGGSLKRARGLTVGRESVAVTERGTSVKTQYKVVEMDSLITSNTLGGGVNPNFPKELQPRDRSKTASKLQVRQIASELDFNRLGESTLASSGSPIVAGDRVVESGNGRILAIQTAYTEGNEASKRYRNQLIENAGNFGLSGEAIAGMKNPVLIRERISDVDRVAFTREANESGVSTMSASEQAKNDAENLTSFILDQYEGGDLRAIKNRPFVQAFMSNIVSTADRNKFLAEKVDRDGSKYGELSSEGEQRIRNAMFAKAFNDADLLIKKVELDDTSNVKNYLQVMEDNAVMYAKIKDDIEQGHLYNHDIAESLVKAVKKADELRSNGESVMAYLNQPAFFEPELTEEERAILYFLDANKRNKANIDGFIKAYVDELVALGNPNELDLFGGIEGLSNGYVTKMQLIEIAVKKVNPEILETMKEVARG